MDGSLTELFAGALAGGLGKYIIDHFIKYRKYNADVDGTVSGNWKMIVAELRASNKDLQLRVDKLELENDELRKNYISLQHQISFSKEL